MSKSSGILHALSGNKKVTIDWSPFDNWLHIFPRSDSILVRWLKNPLADYSILISVTIILTVGGLFAIGSASSVWSSVNYGDAYYYFTRQLVFLAIGLPMGYLISKMNPRMLVVAAWLAMIGSIGLLIAVFTPLGFEVFGNRSWLRLPGLTIQPSEFAKASMVLWAAAILANRDKQHKEMIPLRLFGIALLGCMVVLGLVVLQHDMGTAVVIAAIILAMLWFIGTPIRLLIIFALTGVGAAVVGILTDRERINRLLNFVGHGTATSDQPANAIYGMASGGWSGLGLGRSRQKWGGLYNGAQTDYVLAVIGEELGFIGTTLVLLLFFVLVFAGFRTASRCQNRFLRYAAAGMTSWLAIQAVMNIFVVLRLAPVVGIPLPFISQGGSALLANLAAVGVLMAAARREPGAKEMLAGAKPAKETPMMTTIVDVPGSRKW